MYHQLRHTDLVQAYDSHCNLVLGEVEETIYVIEDDDEEEDVVKVGGSIFAGRLSLISYPRVSENSRRCSLYEVRSICLWTCYS